MNNKELANELIAQFAGYHAPVRFMVQEAAKRILRMDETIDYARTIQAEGVRLKAELESLKNSYKQLQEINDRTFQSNLTMGRELEEVKAELEKVKRERNAAVRDLNTVASCEVCKHGATCLDCNGSDFEWRGVNHG